MEYAKEFMAPHLIDDINKEGTYGYTARSCVTRIYIDDFYSFERKYVSVLKTNSSTQKEQFQRSVNYVRS